MNNKVNEFISRFNASPDVRKVFLNGCCYWFAYILMARFPGAELMYDQIENHFGARIGTYVYDITGDVTFLYDWESWGNIDDPPLKERIRRDCINF